MTIEEYRNCESARLESNRRRMEEDGVNFVDIYSAYIDEEVVIEKGATIAQNVTIKGKSIIRAGAYIGQSLEMLRSVADLLLRHLIYMRVK